MLTHQAIFFFRRYKNNKSTGIFFSLSSSLSLALSLLPIVNTMPFFPSLRESEFLANQINFSSLFTSFVVQEKKKNVVVVTAFDKSCLFYSNERTSSFINKSIPIEIYICIWKSNVFIFQYVFNIFMLCVTDDC